MSITFYELLGIAAFILSTTGIVVYTFFKVFNEFKEKFNKKIDDGFAGLTNKGHLQDLQFKDIDGKFFDCQNKNKEIMDKEFNEVWTDIEIIKKENMTRDNEVIGINERYTQLCKKIDMLEYQMKSIWNKLDELHKTLIKILEK